MSDASSDKAPVRRSPCPHCGEEADLSRDNQWRPFCSKRCKLIDLGDWLSEKHVIGDDDGSHPTGEHGDWQH